MKTIKDRKKDKIIRICNALSKMELGETTNVTTLALSIKIHPDTLRDSLDLFDSLKEIGFSTIRDKQGEIELIIRTDEKLEFRNEIKEIKKDVKCILAELKEGNNGEI